MALKVDHSAVTSAAMTEGVSIKDFQSVSEGEAWQKRAGALVTARRLSRSVFLCNDRFTRIFGFASAAGGLHPFARRQR